MSGVALTYGETAKMPWGYEVIPYGAFGDLADADLRLTLLHDPSTLLARSGGGGLEVIDTPERLEFRADVVRTQAGSDAVEMVRAGLLRGASIEFRAVSDSFQADTRIIRKANLRGFGLVDKPAYPSSVIEARRAAVLEARPRRKRYWQSQ